LSSVLSTWGCEPARVGGGISFRQRVPKSPRGRTQPEVRVRCRHSLRKHREADRRAGSGPITSCPRAAGLCRGNAFCGAFSFAPRDLPPSFDLDEAGRPGCRGPHQRAGVGVFGSFGASAWQRHRRRRHEVGRHLEAFRLHGRHRDQRNRGRPSKADASVRKKTSDPFAEASTRVEASGLRPLEISWTQPPSWLQLPTPAPPTHRRLVFGSSPESPGRLRSRRRLDYRRRQERAACRHAVEPLEIAPGIGRSSFRAFTGGLHETQVKPRLPFPRAGDRRGRPPSGRCFHSQSVRHWRERGGGSRRHLPAQCRWAGG